MKTVKSTASKMFGNPKSSNPKSNAFVKAAIPNPGSPKALFKPKKVKALK